jgi:hypothetical protein
MVFSWRRSYVATFYIVRALRWQSPNRLDPDADALAPPGADLSLFASQQHGISRN